jgi:hypothetical protein
MRVFQTFGDSFPSLRKNPSSVSTQNQDTNTMKKLTSLLAVGIAAISLQSASAALVGWINWNNPGSYPFTNTSPYSYNYANSATGSLILPNGTPVSVTLSGEVEQSLSAFGTTNSNFWSSTNTGGTTYLSANVPTLPPNSDRIGLEGWAINQQTLTFNQTVSNLVMNVWSMGSSGNTGSYLFNQPFTILSQNGNLSAVGNELLGNEGAGTIQFLGSFSSMSWTVSSPEGSAWNIGATSTSAAAVPEPGQVAASLLLLSGIGGYVFLKRRKVAKATAPAAA